MIPNLDTLGTYHDQVMVDGDVWRRVDTPDGMGGSTPSWQPAGTTRIQLVSAGAAERETAGQEGADITHMAILPRRSELARGDRVVVDDQTVELVTPPVAATHGAVCRAAVKQEPWDEPLNPPT